jgi:L-lysine exporter family protein LysE/ArgO
VLTVEGPGWLLQDFEQRWQEVFLGGMVWSLFIAILSSKGGKFIGPKLRQYCCLISGLLFVYFAFKVAIEGYHILL